VPSSARSLKKFSATNLHLGSGHESEANVKPTEDNKTKDQVAGVISNIIVETLRISADMQENNSQSTFPEVSTFFLRFFITTCSSIILAWNGFGYGYDDCEQVF
jgi:hypothetical protein